MSLGTGAKNTGQRAEAAALAHLAANGLKLQHRNYRCRGGEIDLVMRDGDTTVFVEVRFRRSARFGTPEATVDRRKQSRLVRAARHYLGQHGLVTCRFDVVGITGEPPRIHWIRNAFEDGSGTW